MISLVQSSKISSKSNPDDNLKRSVCYACHRKRYRNKMILVFDNCNFKFHPIYACVLCCSSVIEILADPKDSKAILQVQIVQ